MENIEDREDYKSKLALELAAKFINGETSIARREFIKGAKWGASFGSSLAEEQVNEYRSRLKEVLKNTGRLTDLDLDYCLELTLKDK